LGTKKQPRPVVQFHEIIKGERWTIKFYTKKVFWEVWEGQEGVCHYNHSIGYRTINFKTHNLNKDTIAHELFHAYFSYKETRGKTYAQVEEIACEEVGKRYKRIYQLTNKIYKRYKKAKR
jgi:hypothetical protein